MTDVQRDGARRVGVFGGSFDPIHNGHVRVAQAACVAHRLDRLILVPAAHQPHKRSAPNAPASDRMAMVRLAAEGHPEFIASDCELNRPAPSFTIDTIRQLQAQFDTASEWFLIVGADSVSDLHRWKAFDELIRLCLIVVAARPQSELNVVDDLAPHVDAQMLERIAAAVIRDTAVDVSSTQIRELVAAGRPIDGLVPPRVAEYIAENKLYRGQ